MSKVFYLYLLVDPRDPTEVRYVGQTIDRYSRFANHLSNARTGGQRYVCRWIRKLLADGVTPKILTMFSFGSQVEMDSAEVY